MEHQTIQPRFDIALFMQPTSLMETVFVFNMSAGKDSTAAAKAGNDFLDMLGHPRELRIAVHADLGRAEWRSTPATAQRQADMLGLELLIVRRKAGDLFDRMETRWRNALARYEALETYHLIGPWPQANKRFCTSELKAQVIGPELARRFRGRNIVQVMGLRRQESAGRAKTPAFKVDERFAKVGNRHGTAMAIWNPLVEWSTDDVFDFHRLHGLPLHEAYTCYQSSRLSCAFCVLAKLSDQQAAARAEQNHDALRFLVDLELTSNFSFQPERWLAQTAYEAGLLSFDEAGRYATAMARASERRDIEAAMPPELRYVKGWPPRRPTLDEAEAIAEARGTILYHHGLDNRFPDKWAVQERFDQLLAAKAAKIGGPHAEG